MLVLLGQLLVLLMQLVLRQLWVLLWVQLVLGAPLLLVLLRRLDQLLLADLLGSGLLVAQAASELQWPWLLLLLLVLPWLLLAPLCLQVLLLAQLLVLLLLLVWPLVVLRLVSRLLLQPRLVLVVCRLLRPLPLFRSTEWPSSKIVCDCSRSNAALTP